MNILFGKARKLRAVAGAIGIVSLAALSLVATAETALAAGKAKFRSAHFIVTALESKGLKVEDVRRKGQLYLVKASEAGTTAILAIDGFSAELVGLHVVSLAPGAVAKTKGSSGNHFVDITYEYGYIVEESVYSSYTEVTTEEISVSEEYSETSVETSEEVSYESVDDAATGDLDEGMAGDEDGDVAAAADDSGDESVDAANDGGDDSADSADDSSDDGAADDGGSDDGGSDDGGSDEE